MLLFVIICYLLCRCSLFLVEKETQELVAVVFDSELPVSNFVFGFLPKLNSLFSLSLSHTHTHTNVHKETGAPLRIPLGQGIAGYVAQSGKTVNIRDAYKHPQFYKEIDKSTGFVTR